jgi:hypothetical protein
MPTYAEFKNFKDLVLGLHVCSGPRVRFPEQVLQATDGHWIVEISPDDLDVGEIQAVLDSLAPSDPGRVRVASAPPSSVSAPIASVLDGTWVYRDPQTSSGLPIDPAHGTSVHPLREGVRYILAARDAPGAQRLLDHLSEAVVTGIRAFSWPQATEPAPGTRHFWLVTSDDPPVPFHVLAQAERAWWGPLVTRPCQVFVQWPWSLDVALRLLERIPWGPEGSVVLLNHPQEAPGEPAVVVLQTPGQTREFSPLIDVVDLKLRDEVSQPALGQAPAPEAEFEVQVRLVEGTERSTRALRVADLKAEIRALQLALARLEGEPGEPRSLAEGPSEPLFLFTGDPPKGPGQAAMLPDPLQRLNVEWTDQPRELGRLRYLQLHPGALSRHLVAPDRMIHVLTTAAALGEPGEEPGADLVSLRLRHDLSQGESQMRFHLLRTWARFGLRIFLPAGQALRIYPDLPPCATAADKLASVLLPQDDGDRRDWCLLFWRGPEGRTQVCRLRGPFRRLVEASEWKCRLDVPLPEDWAGRLEVYAAEQADQTFVESLERAFLDEARGKGLEHLETRRRELAGELQHTHLADQAALRDQADTLEARIRADREWLDLVEARRQELHTRAQEMVRIQADLEGACRRLEHELQVAEDQTQGLREVANRILGDLDGPDQATRRVRVRTDELRRSLNELLNRPSAPRRRVRGWRRWLGRGQ